MEYFENEKDPLQSFLELQEKAIALQSKDQAKNREENKDQREQFERDAKAREDLRQREIENARLTSLIGYSFSLCPQFTFLERETVSEAREMRETQGADLSCWEEVAKKDAYLKALWIKEFWISLSQDNLSSSQFLSLLGVSTEKEPNVNS